MSEDKYTEFKQSFNDDVIITLVAFANTKGGRVYVGMKDDGNVCGVSLGKESLQNWLNDIKLKTEPSIIPDVDVTEIDGKTVVVLSVQEYPVKPISMRGRYYSRQMNSNHLMTAFEISNSILQTKNSSWDFYVDNQHTIKDVDFDKVEYCISKMQRRGMNISDAPLEFLTKKEYLLDGRLTFGGYLLFKANEDLMTTIELGFFQDAEGVIIKDSARLKTCLVDEVEGVMDFVKKHINVAIDIVPTQTENIQRWDYPLDAIREIVLNMIVHRDYRSSADSVVKIYPDRMEFYNPGYLPEDISIEDLMSNNYSSRPRNKQIADTFKDMGEIEKYGSGIRRVIEMFLNCGLPKPQWKQTSGGTVVTVWKNNINRGTTQETIQETTQETTQEKIYRLSEIQMTIIDYLKKCPNVTRKELALAIGNISEDGVKYNLAKLQQLGLVKHMGSTKSGYWVVVKNENYFHI